MNNTAIIVGCQKYQNFLELKGVNNDITLMREIMSKYCCCKDDDICIIGNVKNNPTHPSGTQILSAIKKYADIYKGSEIDNLFFYFSGHGCFIEREPYLILADTLSDVSYGALSIKQLKKAFDHFANAKNVIMFLDICLDNVASKGISYPPDIDIPKDIIVFYSCSPTQKSYMLPNNKGSIFTNCLSTVLRSSEMELSVHNVSKAIKTHLQEMCKLFHIEQQPQTELPDDSLAEVLISDSAQQRINSENEEPEHKIEQPLDLSKSIWLIDAEKADGEQTRFSTFTQTTTVNEFIDRKSAYWGIASVKGIGKTFLLQVKRIKLSKKSICFPDVVPCKENNWATESIKFSDETPFQKGTSYFDIKILWKYSLVCYVLHCWIKKQYDNSQKRCVNFDNIINWIASEREKKKLSELTYKLLMDPSLSRLQLVIEEILAEDSWAIVLRKEYVVLQRLAHVVEDSIKKDYKNTLVLLLDKLDQTLREPNSEQALDCEFCSKKQCFETCNNEKKGTDYCYGSEYAGCKQRIECCYGCEKYSDDYAGTKLRIDENETLRDRHCNYWQRLQLALVEAVADIKEDYYGFIKIMYTIRLEAYNYIESEWGSQRAKIKSLTCVLTYSRDEQKKIYRECIKNQQASLLFDPSLANKEGREDEAFVGVNGICHPYVTNKIESIFDILFRHSFDRTRDIQDYGQALTSNIKRIKELKTDDERGTCVKEIIEETAARLAYNTNPASRSAENSYYFEKMHQMPTYWAQPTNFERLLNLIDRNLLFVNDIRCICQKINNNSCCPQEGCNQCEHHPFSMLKNMGMLGYIVVSANQIEHSRQHFLSSKDVTYFHDVDSLQINENTMYLMHPALTKSIEKLRNDKKIMHFNAFLIGKDLRVKQSLLESILQDKKNLSEEEFEGKYYTIFET